MQPARAHVDAKHVQSKRASSSARGYGYDWRVASKRFLSAHPLCECDACKASDLPLPSNCVDHIIPIALRPDLRMDPSNWRAMHSDHHNLHTSLTRNPRKGIKS